MMERLHEKGGAIFCVDNASLNPQTGARYRYALVVDGEGESGSVNGPQIVSWLSFQDGNPADVGRNGFFVEEALLAVQLRLQGFQKGPFACPENEEAIERIQQALDALDAREQRLAKEK